MIKLRHLFIIVIISILVLLSSACSKEEAGKKEGDTEGTKVAFQVSSRVAGLDKITEYYDYAGLVKSTLERIILPEIPGRITAMYQEVGNQVKKGDLLFRINDVLYKARYDQTAAALKNAQTAFSDAKKNRDRTEKVYQKKGISKTQYEQVVSAFLMAENGLKQARAGFKIAEFNYHSCSVKAPFSGVITSKNNQEGDYLNPGMTVGGVYTLEDYQSIYIDVDVPFTEAQKIQKGMPADIILNDQTFNASVFAVNKKTDPMSSSVSMRVKASNPDGEILPGQIVQVRIHFLQKSNVVTIPATGLLDGNVVFINSAGMAKRREVQVGLKNNHWVEIVSGINAGDSIIVKGNFGLFDNAPVKENQE